MTRIINEQLSALLDGELPGEQESMLLRRLESELSCRDTLARYGLIGDLVRGAAIEKSALSISGRVSAALERDTDTEMPGRVVESSSSLVGAGFVGAGIAATIALLVVFNLADIGASRAPALMPLAGTTLAESALLAQATPLSSNSLRLTRYLVAHAEFSNTASRQLVNSHIAMPISDPTAWASHE